MANDVIWLIAKESIFVGHRSDTLSSALLPRIVLNSRSVCAPSWQGFFSSFSSKISDPELGSATTPPTWTYLTGANR